MKLKLQSLQLIPREAQTEPTEERYLEVARAEYMRRCAIMDLLSENFEGNFGVEFYKDGFSCQVENKDIEGDNHDFTRKERLL